MGGCKWSFLESGQQHNRMKGKNMANLIIVCGPQAVGKMTVAESLRDKLKYNMMMNHDLMTEQGQDYIVERGL